VDPKEMWVPHRYQKSAETFVYNNTIATMKPGGAALLLDPGMGKTAVMLKAISTMKSLGYVKQVLVVAPKRVCLKVWPDEKERWANFQDLSMGVAIGTAVKRKKILSLPFDIHVINRDNIEWLVKTFLKKGITRLPWQMVVVDESTSFKTWGTVRSKAMRKLVEYIPWRVLLTGTPAPKDLMDLYPQIWLLDQGQSLGRNITEFRKEFCESQNRYKYTQFSIREGMESAIQERVKPLCLRLDIKDYLDMPEKLTQDVMVDLPEEAMDRYRTLEKELCISVRNQDRDLSCAAALYTACKQVTNGGLYDNDKNAIELHDEKVKAVVEILDELQGKPALIPYLFKQDAARLSRYIKGLHVIDGGMKDIDFMRVIDDWNSGKLYPPYLAVQPAALSYGVNMQHGEGRDIIWVGLSDSLELYEQLNARLWRQGIGSCVRIHRVLASNTVDEMVRDRLDRKFDVQANLMTSLRDYAKTHHLS
jgi:SNF2 family DNA or RNA helicase